MKRTWWSLSVRPVCAGRGHRIRQPDPLTTSGQELRQEERPQEVDLPGAASASTQQNQLLSSKNDRRLYARALALAFVLFVFLILGEVIDPVFRPLDPPVQTTPLLMTQVLSRIVRKVHLGAFSNGR